MLLALELGGEVVQGLLVLAGQLRFVEGEQNRCIGNRLVVVEILDRARQAGHVVRSLGGILVSLIGTLTGGHCLLVGSVGLGIHLRDTLLRTAVNVTNIASIFRRLVI